LKKFVKKIKRINIKPFTLVYILLTFNFSVLYSQQKEQGVFETVWKDVKISFNDGINTFSSPARFNNTDWIKTGGVLLTTAAFMSFDKDIRKEFSRNHNDTKDKIADVGNAYGNLIFPVIIGGGIYSYGLFNKDEYVRETGRMIFEAIAFSGIITDVTKVIAGRSRPYTERGPYFYNMFTFNEGSLSFPSGHATVAFALSSVLSNRIKNTYVSIGLYSVSTLTALSRIYSDKHWTSDVIFASAIGYFVGDFVSSDKKNKNSNDKLYYKIYPSIGGMALKIHF
jgi:hypothetical protein